MSPTVAGVTVEVAYSANYQFVVSNTSPQPLTFLADSGEPFLEIGPDGVRGNFASPTFFDSNVPGGREAFPPHAKPGPDVAPIWRRLSKQPSWGWYDHRLHPVESFVPPEIVKAKKVAVLGRWRVPIRYGDQAGEIQGRFEYRPPLGSYGMVQKSPQQPAPGVTVQVVSASVVPAIFVKNESATPVVVLGGQGEPFARIGPQGGVSEVNLKSPTWSALQQALGKDPSDEADPAAAPKWQQVAPTPAWNWLEFRAAAPKSDPPQAVIDRGKTVTVKTWSIPYLIGEQRGAIEGITEWVPIAELQKRVAGGAERDVGFDLALYGGAALAAAVLAAGIWLVTSKVRNHRAV
ncbi:MAG TPA: hypothetical protein VG795_10615 [Acidimicrobiia bacterium]|nr:hypothetical protein [Acidimicrobiia bacterium]